MNEKSIISQLQLASNELTKKAEMSLRIAEGFGLSVYSIDNYQEEHLLQFFDTLKLSYSFLRVHCPACNGFDYKFVTKDKQFEKDKSGLCSRCVDMLVMFEVLEIEQGKIGEWMNSKGDINPFQLIKEKRASAEIGEAGKKRQ